MSARRSARSHFTLRRKAIPGRLQCLPHLRRNLRCHRHNLQFAHCPNLAPEISIQRCHFAGSLPTNLSAIRAQIPGHHLFIYEISVKFLGYFPPPPPPSAAPPPFGNVTTNRVCSHSASKFECPPCALTIPFEMLNPSPVPCPTCFVVKKWLADFIPELFWDTLAAVHHGNLRVRSYGFHFHFHPFSRPWFYRVHGVVQQVQ